MFDIPLSAEGCVYGEGIVIGKTGKTIFRIYKNFHLKNNKFFLMWNINNFGVIWI